MTDSEQSEEANAKPKFIYSAFSMAAWIVLIHELLERFSFYGMRAVLTFYLTDYLGFDDDTATIIYHLFVGFSYMTPLLGTYLADNFFGRYKTIIILGIVYLVGHTLMPLTALVRNVPGPLVAMFILTIGTGGIKPCVAAFGGDQVEKGQDEVLDAFFSVFYMCINIGAFSSQLLTPILREQVKCIDDACYPLAFGVPAVAFGLSFALFLAGTPKYKMYPKPSSPLLNKAVGVIFSGKLKDGAQLSDERVHDGPTEREFVGEVRQALRVCFLFLPFPIYWSLFDQQGSRWVLQGKRMDGYISEGFSLTADQMQSVNPLLIVLVVPIFNNIIYPIFAKFQFLKSATSRIFAGYLVCAAAFGLTGVIDLIVDSRIPEPLDHNIAQVHLFNANRCNITVKQMGSSNRIHIAQRSSQILQYRIDDHSHHRHEPHPENFFNFTSGCGANAPMAQASFELHGGSASRVVVEANAHSDALDVPFDVTNTRVRIVYIGNENPKFRFGDDAMSCQPHSNLTLSQGMKATEYCEIALRQSVPMYINDNKATDISLEGESSVKYVTVIVQQYANGIMQWSVVYDRELNPLHILIQLPQYLLMCTSEVLFSVTALAFAYSEAPDNLKSLLQSAYLVSIFFGNMIVISVAAAPKLPRQAYEFFLFAGLVFIGGFVQLWVIRIYNRMKGGAPSSSKVGPAAVEMSSGKDSGSIASDISDRSDGKDGQQIV